MFGVILRSVAIPIVAILILQRTALGEREAWLAVIITLVIVNILAIIVNIFKILTNSLLLRGGRVISLIISTAIEIISPIVFIVLYLQRF